MKCNMTTDTEGLSQSKSTPESKTNHINVHLFYLKVGWQTSRQSRQEGNLCFALNFHKVCCHQLLLPAWCTTLSTAGLHKIECRIIVSCIILSSDEKCAAQPIAALHYNVFIVNLIFVVTSHNVKASSNKLTTRRYMGSA